MVWPSPNGKFVVAQGCNKEFLRYLVGDGEPAPIPGRYLYAYTSSPTKSPTEV
jgi:hypothetical protein